MKKWLYAVAVVCALGTPVRAEEAASVPDLKLDEVLVTVVVSDIPGLVQQAGDLGAKVQPGMSAGVIKAQVGEMLGDPELKGLPKGSDAAFVVFQPAQVLFVEVGGGKAEEYARRAEENGQMAAAADGVVVIAKEEAALAAGKKLAPAVKSKMLSGSKAPALTVTVEMPRVMKEFGPQIEGVIAMMSASMKQAASEETTGAEAMKMVESYVRFALAMAKQMQRLELTLDLPAEGVRISKAATPSAGSNLAAYLAAPAPKSEDLLKLLPATGAMRTQYVVDIKALAALLEKELTPIAKEVGFDKTVFASLMDLVKKAGMAYSGGFAMDAFGGGKSLLDGSAAYAVADPAAALALLEESVAQSEKGALGDFYMHMGMGMKMALKKDARKHKDIAIHELTLKMEGKTTPEMAKLLGDGFKYEVAMVGKVQLLAMGDTKIEPLIDAALKGDLPPAKPLAAQKLMPSGAAFLMDLDVPRYIHFIATMAEMAGEKDAKLEGIAEKLSGADPLTIAAGVADGKAVSRMLVPVSLIEKVSKAVADVAADDAEPEQSEQEDKPAEQSQPTE